MYSMAEEASRLARQVYLTKDLILAFAVISSITPPLQEFNTLFELF